MLGESSYPEVVGLEANRVFSDEEWKRIQQTDEGSEATVAAEEKYMEECTTKLNENVRAKQLLGDGVERQFWE
jgi:hypothetical protein